MIVYKKRQERSWSRFLQAPKIPLPRTPWAKIAIRIGIPLVALLVLFEIMNLGVMPIVTRHNEEFSLPNIVGMTTTEAEPVLREADLFLQVTSEEYHPDKPTGTILSQFPVGGTMVKSGRTIKAVTSLGQKAVAVPDLSGFSIRQARLILETAGFKMGDIQWTTTDSLPEKVVVFSYPNKGTMIPFGSTVNLMINQGAHEQTVFVPSLVGLSLEEAKARLEERGLKIGLVTHTVDENYLPETVLEQSEEAGMELLPGEEVDVVVSSTD
jgi:serine/threonine-protein kinase